MERQIRKPLRSNTIRGDGGAAVKTEVAAFPTSSYVSHNSWGQKGDSSGTVLLKSLLDFAPQLGNYLNYLNDQEVAANRARGAADATKGKPMEQNPAEAYKAAYYKLKAKADHSDIAAALAQLGERSGPMTLDEYETEKKRILGTAITGDESPYYLDTLVPMLSQSVAETDEFYHRKQRQIAMQEVKGNLHKDVNNSIQAIPEDEKPENVGAMLAPVLHENLAMAKDLGLTTLEMSEMLVDAVGTTAITQGRPELLEAFKVPYKNGSAYNSVLRPKIDDYLRQADSMKWQKLQHQKQMFEYEQGQWQRGLINTVYKSVSDNWGNFTSLSRLKQLVDKAGVEGTDEGFMLDPSQYKDLTDIINGAIEGRGMPELMDPSAYFKAMSAARKGASFNNIISNYGYGLPLAQRKEILYACASGAADAAGQGGPAKTAFNGMRNELESLMKAMYLNQNAAKGTMYFFDGFERASDAMTRFNMKIEAAIADNKGRLPTHNELLKMQQESIKETNEAFTNAPAATPASAGGVSKKSRSGVAGGPVVPKEIVDDMFNTLINEK